MTTFRWHHEALTDEVRRPEEAIDLARAALLVACQEYPGLDIDAYVRKLDVISEQARQELPPNAGPYQTIGIINQCLFAELKFRGNRKHYYDPRNSYLNEVLDRRLGVPITLSLVYIEVARRLEFPVAGVGLPGHFIVKHRDPAEGDILIDPFHQGVILSVEDCRARVAGATGNPSAFRPFHLSPVTKRQLLLRLVNNVKGAYLRQKDHPRALAAVETLLAIAPWDLDEVRDRGLLHYKLGAYDDALADLETYLRFNADARDADRVGQAVERLKTMETLSDGGVAEA
ncbi:MAG: transglutaminase family protein [Chloroflexi bacterium]|nr:transglutaminase family protein [Chloroflexota bacterium]